jgi:hypothetical protein
MPLFFAPRRDVFRLFALAATLVLSAAVAPAQYDDAGEIFIGYSHLSFEPETQIDSKGLNGFEGSLSGYVNEWLGMTGDVSYYRGTTALNPPLGGTANVDLQLWNYLLGPQVRVVRHKRVSGMLRTLFGISRGSASPNTFQLDNGGSLRLAIQESKFALSIGGGLDVNINEQLAWRVIQPEYLMTSFAGGRQGNFRFSTGLIYRFSKRKPNAP